MNEKTESGAAVIGREKAKARRDPEPPTYRTVLIAACVGVLIGLLLKR